MNRKIAMSAFSIVASLALMGGATFAYFTDAVNSQNNAFSTGTLQIAVDQSSGIFQASDPVTNWQPGEERLVRFDVVNQGTLPVHLRAFAVGDWAETNLNENLVKVTQVQYWDQTANSGSGGWATIMSNGAGINGEVYYSLIGDANNLFTLSAGQTEQFRMSVMLDTSATSEYEGKLFNSKIQVHAKQTTNGATWPDPIAIP